jgi:HSP20 family protein
MYWDPFEELDRMHEEMDRLFRRSFGHERPLLEHDGKGNTQLVARTPVYHMQETESGIIAAFELPGVNKADIELNVEDDSIELKVESKTEKKHEDKDKKSTSYFMHKSSFYRKVPLPKQIESSKATAEYKDGVLRIEAPKKAESSGGKRLQIK